VYELWGEPKNRKDVGELFPGAGESNPENNMIGGMHCNPIEDIRQGKMKDIFELNNFIRVDSIEEQSQTVRSES